MLKDGRIHKRALSLHFLNLDLLLETLPRPKERKENLVDEAPVIIAHIKGKSIAF